MTSAADRRRQLGRPASSPSQSRFEYQRRGKAALEQRAQTYAQGGRDNYVVAEVTTYTPQKGDNWLRILPPTWQDAKHYGWDVHVHYGIGPDRLAYLCPDKMGKGPCPICQERAALAGRGMDDAASELRPTYRIAVYVLDRKAPEKGPQLWTMPYRIDQELVALAQDKRSGEVLWPDDPFEGYDIEFTRTGEGIHTQYTGVRIARNASPLDNDDALAFAQKHPIPDVFIFSPVDVLEKAISGQPAPAQKAGAPSAAPASQGGSAAGGISRREVSRPSAPAISAAELVDIALRAADTHNIDIPDSIPDAELAEFVAKALHKIGKLSDYKELEDNCIPF